MIKIKCNYIGGAVAVPTELIDKHLKLASSASFKVLLFILRNPDSTENAEQISMCTGLSVEDAADCLDFWVQNDVIEITDEEVSEAAIRISKANAKAQAPVATAETAKEQKTVTVRSLPVKKPTQREIAKRLAEAPDLSLIYTEAQSILGTFGYDTQALILMIYDYYGFPPEVIITLLQHQKFEGKTSSSAIKARAEDWAKRGLDSLELVEKELLSLEKIRKTFQEIKEIGGFSGDAPTPRISKYIRLWAIDWDCSDELIKYALTESASVITDANKLLKKWASSGIKTPSQAEERKKKSLPKEIKKSYDTDKIGRTGVMKWIQEYADGEEE